MTGRIAEARWYSYRHCAWPRCGSTFVWSNAVFNGLAYCDAHAAAGLAQELPPLTCPPSKLGGSRLICALCGRPVPRAEDIVKLSPEWLDYVPALARRGLLAGMTCAVSRWYWGTWKTSTPKGYRDGWDATENYGTQYAMAKRYPAEYMAQVRESSKLLPTCPICKRPIFAARRGSMTDGSQRHESCLRQGARQ
jgi:hypothetical protein